MPSNRLSLRLGQLPHDVLAALAAQLCSESAALQATAEECLAAHKPLPCWAVERVLLSPDLVPNMLGSLESEDVSAAVVCSQWSAAWEATKERRRRLKEVKQPFDFPEELATRRDLLMASTPDGRLLVHTDLAGVCILDRSMRVLQSLDCAPYNYSSIAATDDSYFTCTDDLRELNRSTYDGTVVAEYRRDGHCLYHPVLAPGGLLFCVTWRREVLGDGEDEDEIQVLDAQTLQCRSRFALGLLKDANQLIVVADELYVCDTGNHRLQVFSLTGEHRRSVVGEWRSPLSLCIAKDRLYLVERDRGEGEGTGCEDGDTASSLQGRRLLVLSLQGDILQAVTHPTEPSAEFQSVCCFDDKLLASYRYWVNTGADSRLMYGLLPLKGL